MARCRGCGADILWAIDPRTGAKIPLDVRAPLYRLTGEAAPNGTPLVERLEPDAGGRRHYGVTHFATCSRANDFGKGRAPRAAGTEEVGEGPGPHGGYVCRSGHEHATAALAEACVASNEEVPDVLPAVDHPVAHGRPAGGDGRDVPSAS